MYNWQISAGGTDGEVRWAVNPLSEGLIGSNPMPRTNKLGEYVNGC